ncbi:flavin reductase family protein [Pseudarthrobacter sp. NIBRBAC000502771]|uniref:flavin reductase family protein n=1 Tax=Pseudarthrobacter sp. NIBRBAC000502771 TaxID=2590774 RepID=UPI00143DA65A|nr:flavin reductase [Pseudarthrobacter sp. NIBRBAC000502771]
MFTTISPSVHYFGSLVALLTTGNPDGTTNITPISSAWSLGDHYVLGLSSHHQGYRNLIRTKEVVLNLPEDSMAPAIERISMTTGSEPVPAVKAGDYRTAHDKWALAGWDPMPGVEVAPNRIAQCPVHIEAALVNSWCLEDDLHAVQVRVQQVHVRDDLALDSSRVDVRTWQPMFYTFRHYFGKGSHLGQNARAEQKLTAQTSGPSGRRG